MFTGIIEDMGELVSLERKGRSAKVMVRSGLPLDEIEIGESIAVNGACLTVEKVSAGTIRFHALAETLSKTNLGGLRAGEHVNLERAMKLGGRLGGHIVTGHVDFCAKVLSAGKKGDDYELRIGFPTDQRDFFAPKGSVAVNGVSLTIASLADDSFTVCLIPVTRNATNLNALSAGSLVNIETDILGKYVVGAVRHGNSQGITMESLINAGF